MKVEQKTGESNLFWRKKNDDEITLEFNTSDRRKGVRIHPLDIINVSHQGNEYQVRDISTCGIAIMSGVFRQGDKLRLSIHLPVEKDESKLVIVCQVAVVGVSENICHCDFVMLSTEMHVLLDRFILNEQKRQIRMAANRSK